MLILFVAGISNLKCLIMSANKQQDGHRPPSDDMREILTEWGQRFSDCGATQTERRVYKNA